MPTRRYLKAAAITAHVAAAALVATLLAVVGPFAPSPAATVYADGSTPQKAAASCWEIKRGFPTKPSGTYWLVTPAMPAPMRMYCDQKTDGGGWVMVARGRHQWTEAGDGTIGSQSWATALPVDGSRGTMLAKQLPGSTIDQLVNSARIDSLTDPIRIRRAANTSGTAWQETRVRLAARDRWSWAFSSRLAVRAYSVNGQTTTATQSWRDLSIGKADDARRTWNYRTATNGWTRGFNYGANGPRGTSSSTSYLYSSRADGRFATPFTQMYLRPRLVRSQLTYPRIPDGGTAPIRNRPVVDSRALPNRWGVTGLGAGGRIDTSTEVSAFLQIGSVMYVGGNFTHVRDNQTGTSYAQPYLAAFDATTGAWISSFRPRLNNQVKALADLNGRLAVGGQFTSANGETRRAVTVLTTGGSNDPGFFADLNMSVRGSKLWVRSLLVANNQLYVGGQFTGVRGGSTRSTFQVRNNIARLAADGTPTAWAPNLGTGAKRTATTRSPFSSVNSMTYRNGLLYAAGHFTQAYMRAEDGRPTITQSYAAAITTGTSATFQSFTPRFSTAYYPNQYQQTVLSAGPWIWLGGSQHSLARYRADNRAYAGASITLSGGDFQAITEGSGVVYGGCHCNDWNLQDTLKYDEPRGTGFTQVDRIGYVGAYDLQTGKYLPSFAPTITTRHGEGAWALATGSDGTLWAGGDFVKVVTTNNKTEWAGGFVRFPRTPSTAPAAPTNLQGSAPGSTASLSWTRSSTSDVTYEVLEGNRVVGFSSTSSLSVPVEGTSGRYFVRAVDAAGNRSASTPVRVVARGTAPSTQAPTTTPPTTPAPTTPAPTTPPPTTPPPTQTTTLLPTGTSWSISTDQTGTGWRTGGFAGTWTSGLAPIGWGTSAVRTTVPGTPVVAYLRREFTLAQPGGVVTITTRADDGAAIYVNGTEVGRRNLPSGTLTGTTRATASPSGTALDWTITVPSGVLKSGRNLVAVEVHRGPGSSPDAFFDLSVTQKK